MSRLAVFSEENTIHHPIVISTPTLPPTFSQPEERVIEWSALAHQDLSKSIILVGIGGTGSGQQIVDLFGTEGREHIHYFTVPLSAIGTSGGETFTSLTLDEAQAEWKAAVDAQVDELADLQVGWDSYVAPAIEPAVIADAKALIPRIAQPGVPPPSVVPTINGTIQLEWHTLACDAEVEILAPGRYYVFTSGENQVPWEGEATLNETVWRLQQMLKS